MSAASVKRGLSLFETPQLADDPAAEYEALLGNAELAETLGYETYWVAEGRFSSLGLPAALAFLAALSQRTAAIRLGTAVVPLAFDHPIRIAETAAVVNVLSGDRLELGVGKSNPGGFSAAAFQAFGLDESRRDELYHEALRELRTAFDRRETVGEVTRSFYPPAKGLPARIWQATGNADTARSIAEAGDGIQLNRFALGGDTAEIQYGLVRRYLDHLAPGRPPRIGISRTLLPAADRAEGVDAVREQLERYRSLLPGFDSSTPIDALLDALHIFVGTPEEIVRGLLADRAFVAATDYLFNIPLPFGDERYRHSVVTIAEDIYPELPIAASGSARPALSYA